MTEPIRVLHFADVHIGVENYGRTDPNTGVSSRVVDFLHRMDEMVDYARANDADLAIFAGDAFKNALPNPTYQREFAWRVRDLAQGMPVVLLVGNHDVQPSEKKASSIEIYSTLDVPNVWVLDTWDVFDINTKRGRVVIGAAPYPVRARLLTDERTHNKSVREIDELLLREMITRLQNMAREADRLAGVDVPRLLTGHFTVTGATLGSERSIMLGRDVQVPLAELTDDRWDYVALGHVHKHQNLTHGRTGVPPVVYSGSIERVDFGEALEDKGFCWVELARGATTWRFVPVAARPMVTIQLDCRQDKTPTQTLEAHIRQLDVKGAIVRLRLQFTPETLAYFREERVRDVLRQAGAEYISGIERMVERPERARLGISPEGLTHEELLDLYWQGKGKNAQERAALLALAREILHED